MYQSVAGIFLGGDKYVLVLGRASLSNAHFCYYMAEKLQGGSEGGWGARAYCATSWLCPCYLHTHTKKTPNQIPELKKKKKGGSVLAFGLLFATHHFAPIHLRTSEKLKYGINLTFRGCSSGAEFAANLRIRCQSWYTHSSISRTRTKKQWKWCCEKFLDVNYNNLSWKQVILGN